MFGLKNKMASNIDLKKISYTKPDYSMDRERERKLLHIATKGVTQLFNAVADRQKLMENKINEISGKPMKERKRILEDFSQQQSIGNATKRKLGPKREKKLEPKKEEVAESDEFTNLPDVSSGVEDTDIEIKEEFDDK